MCDDSWDAADAQVVCRQLGYPTSNVIAFNSAYFGQGTGPIHMDDVSCVGTESSLLDCNYTRYHDCHNFTGAGIRCGSKFHTCMSIIIIIINRLHFWKHSSCWWIKQI